MMKLKYTYGWYPDIPDQRDYLYNAIRPVVRLSKQVDLRNFCSIVEDQGSLGSCTAQALAGNLEFIDNKIDSVYTDVSRLFIYYNERVLTGSVDYDSGASLRDGIKSLKNSGVCEERLWSYTIEKFDEEPPVKCYKDAKSRRIKSYYRIESLREMLTCLTDGYPFVFGFTVYESFETERVVKTGKVNMPRKGEAALGGHAVMAVGYNQGEKRVLVRNSWGAGWGMDGYFTMPFRYLETLAEDFWTVRK